MARDLRERILRAPLGMKLRPQDTAQDAQRRHLGVFQDGVLIGCCSLLWEGDGTARIKQMAVDQEHQRRGTGRLLMQAAEMRAREYGCSRMVLAARVVAQPFYETLGYHTIGDVFVEVKLPHIEMEKSLH